MLDNGIVLEKDDESLEDIAKDQDLIKNIRRTTRHNKSNGNAIKFIKMVKNTIITIVLIIVLILTFQGIKIKASANYIPVVLGHTYLNVLTESMVPEFKPKDLIIGRKIKDASNINVGDIVTYRDGRVLVSHRVVEVVEHGKSFRLKGDANNAIDVNVVSSENLVSKYVFKIPKGGYIASKFQDLTFIGLVCLILMYFIIKELIIEIKKEKQKTNEIKQKTAEI